MPALINCHTHLYSTLARGIALPGRAPKNFPEILKKLWWRLDRALTPDDVYYSALVGLVDCAKNGVGTLVDHHSSPNACAGSLDQVERAFREVGLRGVLCYETSDRDGPDAARAALAENIRFIERTGRSGDGLIAASFGLHASFTLSDRTLRQAVEAEESLGSGFHIHVAEDRCDLEHARRRFKKTVVGRLRDLGVLTDRTLAAHCVHVTAGDIAALAKLGANVVHNPQSNSNNAVGIARLLELMEAGVLVGLGSDGYSPRMWEEFKTAFHLQKVRTGDPRVGYAEAYAAAFLNNRTIAKKLWGMEIGRIEAGRPGRPHPGGLLSAHAAHRRQPVRPSAVRHRQRADRHAGRERPHRAQGQALRHRGRARGGRARHPTSEGTMGTVLTDPVRPTRRCGTPSTLPAALRQPALAERARSNELDPLNLFNITWRNRRTGCATWCCRGS